MLGSQARVELPKDLNPLPDGWSYQPLSSLVDAGRGISYGIVQPGSSDPLGVPIVRVNNIKQGRIITDDVLRVNAEIESKYARTRLCGGEVLLTLVGTLGECAVVPEDLAGWNVARAIGVIPVRSDIDSRWVAFCLRSRPLQHYIRTWATTTVQATFNLRDVAKLPIPLPPRREREEIIAILGTLDDKIELNRRMNETLEAMARAIFKSWFVDFDPVRAKMEGRQPAGMDAEAAALFPDAFEDSPLGKIPKGWRVSTIGEEVRVVGGSTPSTKEPSYWDDGMIHWATPKDLAPLASPVLLDTERRITERGLQQISSGLLPKRTVLLSSRAPIGYLAISEVPVAVNQGFIAMVCDRELPDHYILRWAQENMGTIEGRANGTIFLEISKTNFRPIPIVVPPKEVLWRFIEQADAMHQKVVINLRESRTLAAMRDSLLPKLLSGEVRIKHNGMLV